MNKQWKHKHLTRGLVLLVRLVTIAVVALCWMSGCSDQPSPREVHDFNRDWQFALSDSSATVQNLNESIAKWRKLDVPHDWSIEGAFSPEHPAGVGGGALPGGIGWYTKDFLLDADNKAKRVFVQFDGVYQNSTVWVNGQQVGNRPNGYISFEYDITDYLFSGERLNTIVVKVDNADQPNSRWYSGSGIYRDVRLVITDPLYIPQYGIYTKMISINENKAVLRLETEVSNQSSKSKILTVEALVLNPEGKQVSSTKSEFRINKKAQDVLTQQLDIDDPELWDLEDPSLYEVVVNILEEGRIVDRVGTTFGIRSFRFDLDRGFILNGDATKIKGVCLHHDLGCLGTAFNLSATQRQLEIMQRMGVNAIRTSHNPPAPQLLNLCDKMGILVMDETFDMWSIRKSTYDYAQYWDAWHNRDLIDHIRRDRNHPSVFAWSIGNEIIDQWSPVGDSIASELARVVRELDDRPVTAAMNPPSKGNTIAGSGALDLIGYNYHHEMYERHKKIFPQTPFISTESTSALATRGYYDQRSDTIKRWPIRWDLPFTLGNPDHTVSAYDQVSAPWGSTHEETWKVVKNEDYLSGMFIWTGFDYLGEPTPYTWPARSSYFGVVDLAGFPKDAFYMYQSEWTSDTVLHVFPHWNWTERDSVDVWVYYNHADEVELFLNGQSLETKSKGPEDLHVMWRVAYEPGILKVVSRKGEEQIAEQSRVTAGDPSNIKMTADRAVLSADGKDLSFITVEVLDIEGYAHPRADNLIRFSVSGPGSIVGVDNGDPTSHLSLKGAEIKIFNGKCLVVVQSTEKAGVITVKAESIDLTSSKLEIKTRL